MFERTYDDETLVRAVASSTSWRGVLRCLGLKATSGAASRSAQSHARRLALDTSHFTNARRWTEDDLAQAIASNDTWEQVVIALGLHGGASRSLVKGHALRLGLDTSHLGRRQVAAPQDLITMRPQPAELPRAGSLLAAAWFTMCGYSVTWPLEPCRYDLVAVREDKFLRIQVKTSWKKRSSSWVVSLTTSGHPTGGRHRQTVYDPDDIDYFFAIDGDLNYYLIPIASVGGLTAISLSVYRRFRLDTALSPDLSRVVGDLE